MSQYENAAASTRPDPRKYDSWCREGITHEHDACGRLWNSVDPAERERAARYADDLGETERARIGLDTAVVKVVDPAGGCRFVVELPNRPPIEMSPSTTAADVVHMIADLRAAQIREERAPNARPAIVGDILGSNDPLPDNVLAVETTRDRWLRATDADRYADDESGPYDWIAPGGGGWTTTEGLYDHAPILVTKVRANPAAESARAGTKSVAW